MINKHLKILANLGLLLSINMFYAISLAKVTVSKSIEINVEA
jgi:hypothetical protein